MDAPDRAQGECVHGNEENGPDAEDVLIVIVVLHLDLHPEQPGVRQSLCDA